MIYAVIPTGNRPNEYKCVIEWCYEMGVVPITIATSEEATDYAEGIAFIDSSKNISRWWNLGLEYAYNNGTDVVLVLNDDVSLPETWLHSVTKAISSGCTGASGQRATDRRYQKIAGYAFALNAKDRVYADENLVWYYGDDAIQRECEAKNGFKIIRDLYVDNKYGRTSERLFLKQIKLDEKYYKENYL